MDTTPQQAIAGAFGIQFEFDPWGHSLDWFWFHVEPHLSKRDWAIVVESFTANCPRKKRSFEVEFNRERTNSVVCARAPTLPQAIVAGLLTLIKEL